VASRPEFVVTSGAAAAVAGCGGGGSLTTPTPAATLMPGASPGPNELRVPLPAVGQAAPVTARGSR
jgi:hypothetical protein